MKIGIVGSEGAKFTPITEAAARVFISTLLTDATWFVSGECHLGGVDSFAREEAERAGIRFKGYPPRRLTWDGGYKQRNLQIVEASDRVYCITLRELPEEYTGMRFSACYHCRMQDHVKSGGCWTVKQAVAQGKEGRIVVIDPAGNLVDREWQ